MRAGRWPWSRHPGRRTKRDAAEAVLAGWTARDRGDRAGIWPLPQREPAGEDVRRDGLGAQGEPATGAALAGVNTVPPRTPPSKSGTVPPPVEEVMSLGAETQVQAHAGYLETVPRPGQDAEPIRSGSITGPGHSGRPACGVCDWPLNGDGRCTGWAGPPHDGWAAEVNVPGPADAPPLALPPCDDGAGTAAGPGTIPPPDDEAAAAVQAQAQALLIRAPGVRPEDLEQLARPGDGRDTLTGMTAVLPVPPEGEQQ